MHKCAKLKVTGNTVEHHMSTHSSGNLPAVHGKRIESYEQATKMGISYGWDSDCDEHSSCSDNYACCFCVSGNASSRNGHPNAPVICHTPSEHSHSTNNVDNGNTADEEAGVNTSRPSKDGIFQNQHCILLFLTNVLENEWIRRFMILIQIVFFPNMKIQKATISRKLNLQSTQYLMQEMECWHLQSPSRMVRSWTQHTN